MEDDVPAFPNNSARACEDDGKPPIMISTNYYGELECTQCGYRDCNQIFARQVSTQKTAPIWALDPDVNHRIRRTFLEEGRK